MHPRVLVVGTVPYDTKESSRAFDAYFHFWERENLAQIFSNPKVPCKGHCNTLYQITDKSLLLRWLAKEKDIGKIYYYEDLLEERVDLEIEDSLQIQKAYQIGRKHTPITRLLRGILWKKKFWCTEKFNRWLDEFQPECVFLAFSDDYFIPRIALYIAQKYNIPIVSCIGDDYYFNKHFSLNPIYQIYKESYKALIRKVLKYSGGAIYISDKIKDKYNSEFNLNGETVYLTSTVQRKKFQPVNVKHPLITYFGNIRMGRNHSLCDIADALGEINPEYKIEVYSNELDESNYKILQTNPYVIYGGAIPYKAVQEKIRQSDITVIVEGFDENDIELSRYSLSTKAADALASGTAILAYGSEECGIIEYMKSTNAATVCTNKKDLSMMIRSMIEDVEQQQRQYEQQIFITEQHHNLNKSTNIATTVIERTIRKSKEIV